MSYRRSHYGRFEKVGLAILLCGEAVLGTLAFSASPASAAPVSVNVCFKTGSELDLNSATNANTRAKLTNTAYFGTAGTAAPETFVFKTLATITAATLSSNGCQIYFGGGSISGNGTDDLTTTEVSNLVTWLQSPGRFIIAGCDYANSAAQIASQVCSGYRTRTNLANGGISVNSLLSYNPLTCGGALTIQTFGGISSYYTLNAGDEILAKSNTSGQEPTVITDSLVNPKFLFTGDADMFGSSGSTTIGAGPTATSDQAKLIVNSFKFALDAIMGRLGNPQCFASYDQKADLALSISTTNASPTIGGQTTVTITVTNQGPSNVTGVTAIANLPSGLTLASQSGTGSYSTSTQAWSIGSLVNGASASITLTLNVNSSGSFSIPAQITQSSLADSDSSTNVGFGVDDLSDGLADDDEASLTLTVASPAKVLLVKRITAINGDRTKNPNDNTALNAFVDDTTSIYQADDNSTGWPAGYLLGAINAGQVKPGDDIEYTVYFLNAGGSTADTVKICDLVAGAQDFKPDAYGTNQDIELKIGKTTNASTFLTRANDVGDRAQVISSTGSVPSSCNLKAANTNSTVVLDVTGTTGAPALTTLPNTTGTGAPDNAFGFFRFTTKVKP